MSESLDKLKALRKKLEAKVHNKHREPSLFEISDTPSSDTAQSISHTPVQSLETLRQTNLTRLRRLFSRIGIAEKHPDFHKLFEYKAMNLSGIVLKEEAFGQIREGKYVQIITIDYEPDKHGKKRAKNRSLAYFGKAENLSAEHKRDIIEFVLRWRYEKAIQNVLHYESLLNRIEDNT